MLGRTFLDELTEQLLASQDCSVELVNTVHEGSHALYFGLDIS
jgi:hypothetical protein